MFSGKLQKYRGLFIAVTSLVVFFLVYLFVGQALQRQALSSIGYSNAINGITEKLDAAKLGDSTAALSSSINVLENGGTIDGERYESLKKFLAPETAPIGELSAAFASGNIQQAKTTMASINTIAKEKTKKRLALTNTLQIVAAILTLLLYVLVVIPLFFRIKETDETVATTQKETEGIMGTVSEGLFLLNSDHEIGVEQSASLKGMFKLERDLEGNFFDFIIKYVTQDAVNIAKDYIELLFGDRVKERLVEDLNPLKQVEINLIRRDGSYENRYLDFKFKRVLVDGKLSHLLGSVTDVTKQVVLERQLEESKEEQEAQIDLLMSILHVDNRQLKTFFTSTETALNSINETLESRGYDDSQIRTKLRDISRDVHRIKGDAAALNLNNFEFASHELENEIETVQKENKKITGKLLLPVATKLRDLFAELERMKSLMSKFSDAMTQSKETGTPVANLEGLGLPETAEQDNSAVAATAAGAASVGVAAAAMSGAAAAGLNSDAPEAEASETAMAEEVVAEEPISQEAMVEEAMVEEPVAQESVPAALEDTPRKATTASTTSALHTNLERLASTVGERNGVEVDLRSTGLGDDQIPDWLSEPIQSTLVQLVRNSIVHGGETPEIRASKGKSNALNIHADFKAVGDTYRLTIEDDGLGINSEKIIEQAFKKELISEEQSKTFGAKEALSLIFSPGFSSKEDADLDGGRGVGLDVVFELTKKNNGKISIKSGKGQFCKFLFTYPATQA